MNASPVTVTSRPSADTDDLGHTYCCRNEDVALCGADLTGVPETDECTDCVVCLDLDDPGDVCPRNGLAPCPPIDDGGTP